MRLKLKSFKLQAGKPIAFIHEKDAEKLHLHIADRVKIWKNSRYEIAVVDIVSGFIKQGEIALSQDLIKDLDVSGREYLDIEPTEKPKSSKFIQSALKCEPYTKQQLVRIISDIVEDKLTEAEIAYFVSGVYHCGMDLKETKYLTEAIFETGKHLSWNGNFVADKHSIGGIPNNRTTPIVVSICASAGITMPKTSSRAITSAAGTADVIETLARVDFSLKEMKEIVKKTNACLVWGGSLGLAPADDKIIQIEKILNIDPEPQLLASILSKKLSAGSKYVLIDIPYGDGAKVSKKEATRLKKRFILLGKMLGLEITVALTDGSQPIGNGIGPVLEMRDVLSILRRENGPKDLEKKSVYLAGLLLEIAGKAKRGKGRLVAHEILNSGKAYKKFEEIINAQGGKISVLPLAKFSRTIKSSHSGKIKKIDNKGINYTARLAGCPSDKSSGIYLFVHKNEKVKKGDNLLVVYAESQRKLREAVDFFNEFKPITIA